MHFLISLSPFFTAVKRGINQIVHISNDTDKSSVKVRKMEQFFTSQSSHWRYVVLDRQEIVKVNNLFHTPFNHRYCKICHFTVHFMLPTLISISSGHAIVSFVLDSIKRINIINKRMKKDLASVLIEKKIFLVKDSFCQSNVNFSKPFGVSWMGRDYFVAK